MVPISDGEGVLLPPRVLSVARLVVWRICAAMKPNF